MRIGEVADRAGIPARTLRFWEQQRLLPPPARTAAGYRDYDPEVIERLGFIRHAQAAGLTLDEIRQILDIGDDGDPPCAHVRLAQVEERIAELQVARAHLEQLAQRAATQDPATCDGFCSIITPPVRPARRPALPSRRA